MKKIIIIAPHYSDAEKNGANTYVRWVRDCLATNASVDMLDAEGLSTACSDGSSRNVITRKFRARSAFSSTVNTILAGGQYFVERLNPPGFFKKVPIDIRAYDLVVFSFAHSYLGALKEKLLFRPGQAICVLTHNFDIDIYSGWTRSRNLVRRWVGRKSLARYRNSLAQIPNEIAFGHISETDCALHRTALPRLTHVLIPSGAPIPKVVAIAAPEKIRLIFVGSLSTPFNLDGLEYFLENIQPTLSKLVDFEFHVAGSNPPPKLYAMAKAGAWTVAANLSDDELDTLLSTMTCGVLPFKVTQGVKVKIWRYLASGLPVLGTKLFATDAPESSALFWSDDAQEWASWLRLISQKVEIKKKAYMLFEEQNKQGSAIVSQSINNLLPK